MRAPYLRNALIALLAFLTASTTSIATTMSTNSTTYFGYGSNLWKHQMSQRCPTSDYLGTAKLSGFRWIINQRGYANVVETDKTDEVWGLVYNLRPKDERRLDLNEGVPIAYTKENITVSFWPAVNGSKADIESKAKEREMLVYIDRVKTKASEPKKEYIYRMNMGIKDALSEGVPSEYVEGVMRKFIPDEGGEEVAGLARKQAVMFEDEE